MACSWDPGPAPGKEKGRLHRPFPVVDQIAAQLALTSAEREEAQRFYALTQAALRKFKAEQAGRNAAFAAMASALNGEVRNARPR